MVWPGKTVSTTPFELSQPFNELTQYIRHKNVKVCGCKMPWALRLRSQIISSTVTGFSSWNRFVQAQITLHARMCARMQIAVANLPSRLRSNLSINLFLSWISNGKGLIIVNLFSGVIYCWYYLETKIATSTQLLTLHVDDKPSSHSISLWL